MCILLQKFACNGTVIEHPEYGEVIQLQGDQRKNICQFLLEVSGCFVDTLAMALSLEWFDRPCFYTVLWHVRVLVCDWNCLLLTVGATKKNVISY